MAGRGESRARCGAHCRVRDKAPKFHKRKHRKAATSSSDESAWQTGIHSQSRSKQRSRRFTGYLDEPRRRPFAPSSTPLYPDTTPCAEAPPMPEEDAVIEALRSVAGRVNETTVEATNVIRGRDGQWRIVHRHGSPFMQSARASRCSWVASPLESDDGATHRSTEARTIPCIALAVVLTIRTTPGTAATVESFLATERLMQVAPLRGRTPLREARVSPTYPTTLSRPSS